MVDTIHKFEFAGLGRAPYRLVDIIGLPNRGLLETNTGLYNQTMAEAVSRGNAWGVKLGTCDYCGHGLTVNCVLKSADNSCFVVGSDCVKKADDKGLVNRIRSEQRRRKAEEKQRIGRERWEAGRAERERFQREREIAAKKQQQAIAQENEWILSVLREQSGQFCQDMAHLLSTTHDVNGLAPRAREIVGEIYARQFGRRGSKGFDEGLEKFETLANKSSENIDKL